MADTGRRRWLLSLIPRVAGGVADAIESRIEAVVDPQRRPPGAVPEALFLATCTRCDDCIAACPHGAIWMFPEDAGALAKTPVMVPDLVACHMCDGWPCAAACETGALNVPATTTVKLADVRLRTDRCIAYMGPECGACQRWCPGEIDAVKMFAWKPVIDTDECIGCGLCIGACPTDPKAIEIV